MTSFRTFSSAFTTVVLLAGLTASTACSTTDSASSAAPDNGSVLDDRTDGGATTALAEDGGAQKPDAYRGNPLCHVTADTCMPDDDAYHHATGTKVCVAPAVDGGTADAGAADAPSGCRLTTVLPDGTAPDCLSATAAGVDGATCSTGSDCAPGFDCVEGDKGSVCRRYCCLDTCSTQTSQNGGATFCDVQKLVDTNQKAPVCMPLKRCKLLTQGDCSANETCAVVDETGDTGCVGVGPAQVGQACDENHCAAGLTCLGQAGNRKCYQLCRVSSTTCPASQVCKTSTVFKDMTIGVCQTP